MKKLIFLSLLYFFTSIQLEAQVTIAPTNMFIDSNSRFGTYMVINGSNQTQEITIDFFFGYSVTDERGIRTLATDSSEIADSYSVADKIRAFPQNFTLTPGQRQVVRLRVNASNDIPDQTYWARIKTTSQPQSPPLELQNTQSVSARVSISVEQVTGLFYKKGTVETGIEINDITTEITEGDNGKIAVLTSLYRTGNTPFLGTITNEIIDENGSVVKSGFISTSIYFDGVHRHEFDMEGLSPGNYRVKVTFESSRSDIADSDIVKMQTVTKTSTFAIR